jgi:phosphohistidine phosphatase
VRLLLLRHAKSDWSGQGGESTGDHERPLSARGRKAVPRVAAYMRKHGYQPQAVLCSTAARARETLELLLAHLETPATITKERALYLAEWPQLLAEIRAAPAAGSPLLLVGHNPGLEQLALALALQPQGPAERARAEKLAEKFPTAGLAVLDFEFADWSEIKPGSGKLVDYVRPKDLGMRGEQP